MIGKNNEIMLRNKADEIIIERFDDMRFTVDDAYIFIDVESLASNIVDDLIHQHNKIDEDDIDYEIDCVLLSIFSTIKKEMFNQLCRNLNLNIIYEVGD